VDAGAPGGPARPAKVAAAHSRTQQRYRVDALARAFAELDAPSYDTSMRWVAGDDPAAAADAMRRLDAQMNMMRFHQQRLWMFGR
jgi:hypothetical protein